MPLQLHPSLERLLSDLNASPRSGRYSLAQRETLGNGRMPNLSAVGTIALLNRGPVVVQNVVALRTA